MQNGGFGWANSLSSSLAAQKVSWSGVGYQTSLTDLFFKKAPLHQLNTGISQLAVASSYLEKMSNFSGSNTGQHVSDHQDSHAHQEHHQHHSHQQQQHLSQPQIQMKCPHPESKNKPGQSCELCQEYQTLCLPHPGSKGGPTNPSGDLSSQSTLDKSHHGQSSHHHPHLQSQSSGLSSSILQHLPGANSLVGSGINLLQSPIGPNRRNSNSTSNCSRNNNNSTSRSGNPSTSTNKTFICPVCHRNFTQKGNLKTHMMIHSGDKPYSCQVCGKCFTQKGNVDTHMKIHTGEKDQNCQLCGKRFTQRGNLRTHMRSVHTKEKPHSCSICGKSFSQKGNMMTHLRTHNKDDRFPCTLCGKTFSQKGNLKTHMQRHSGTLPARRYGPRAKKSQSSSSSAIVSSQFGGGNPSTSRETVVRSNLKPADDDSASSLDRVGQETHLSHEAVHLTKQHQQVLDANQHLLNQHRTASTAAAQMGMQFPPRFYPQSSTIAPLAHSASWLAAAGASAVAGIAGPKGRMTAPPYDSFSLSSYAAGFQHPSHLGRLSLLNASSSHHLDHHGNHEDQLVAQHKSSRGASSTVTTSGSSSTTHTGHEYNPQQSQPNPDFSQLLD